MTFKARIGQFFLFIGLMTLIVFVGAGIAGLSNYLLFFLGLLGVVLGFILWWRGRTAPTPAERFRILHNMQQKRAESRAMKDKEKKD